ncbi:hypothetical protein GQF42_43775 [Streptomyces broussonetiae]|uniref:Uncharacterized protein n=1 Tax=Streptomyces broussonetiae TaxID=2686304 RepID=A0A6I6N7K0_9ACTN|nr:hypothetical protein [Streptomyces broussonetiae]QHA09198.1 hypothetical protein GQF42_43775 [Streptomyces broussonetiae]
MRRHAVVLAGRARLYTRLSVADRRRLCRESGQPLWLWPAEHGRPMDPAAWQAAFRRTNERCAAFGLDCAAPQFRGTWRNSRR